MCLPRKSLIRYALELEKEVKIKKINHRYFKVLRFLIEIQIKQEIKENSIKHNNLKEQYTMLIAKGTQGEKQNHYLTKYISVLKEKDIQKLRFVEKEKDEIIRTLKNKYNNLAYQLNLDKFILKIVGKLDLEK